MSTFKEEIAAQIAKDKAEIAILEGHLASGELWLEQESSSLWQRFKHLFSSAASKTGD